MEYHHILLLIVGWIVAAGSPGPATLAISSVSMNEGRASGLAIASGVTVGSAIWGITSAMGMSAIMLNNAWVLEVVRYLGAAYLLYLALKSLRRALSPANLNAAPHQDSLQSLFLKGALLHLTNPKAVLAWGAIYAVALPSEAGMLQIWQLFGVLISASVFVFLGYGWLFSAAYIANGYARMRRWFELTFAVLFGTASLKILTVRLT